MKAPKEFNYFPGFLNNAETRQAIHVGSIKFNDDGTDVEMALINVSFVDRQLVLLM